MLRKNGYRPKPTTWDFEDIQPLYDVISVLRTFCLEKEDREVYERMQDNLHQWTQRTDFIDKFG